MNMKNKSLFSENDKKMITEDGNIKRYINSDIVDEFNEGDCADISFPNGYNKANRVFKGYCPCINVATTKCFIVKVEDKKMKKLRIRKLTPKECWRLMGFDDVDIDKCIQGGISNAQLYKQAGNSICTNVLECLFNELFKAIEI